MRSSMRRYCIQLSTRKTSRHTPSRSRSRNTATAARRAAASGAADGRRRSARAACRSGSGIAPPPAPRRARCRSRRLAGPARLSARVSDCASTCSGRRERYSSSTVRPNMTPAGARPTRPACRRNGHMNEPAASPPAVWYSASERALTQSGTSICTVVVGGQHADPAAAGQQQGREGDPQRAGQAQRQQAGRQQAGGGADQAAPQRACTRRTSTLPRMAPRPSAPNSRSGAAVGGPRQRHSGRQAGEGAQHDHARHGGMLGVAQRRAQQALGRQAALGHRASSARSPRSGRRSRSSPGRAQRAQQGRRWPDRPRARRCS